MKKPIKKLVCAFPNRLYRYEVGKKSKLPVLKLKKAHKGETLTIFLQGKELPLDITRLAKLLAETYDARVVIQEEGAELYD